MSAAALGGLSCLAAVVGFWAIVCIGTWRVFFGKPYLSSISGRRKLMEAPPGKRYRVTAVDGLSISYWVVEGTLPVVLVLAPGYRSRVEEYGPVAARIASAGFTVALVRWRGCSAEDRSGVTFGVREQEDLRVVLKDVRRQWPGTPLALVGISFGASMAILAASAGEHVDALWLDGPFLDPISVLCDAVRRRFRIPFGPLVAWPVAWYTRLMRRVRIWNVRTDVAAKSAPKVPTRVLIYDSDRLVPLQRSLAVARAAGWTDDVERIEKLGHAYLFEADPETYVARLKGFIGEALLAQSIRK
jgi:alpha-beta hydrolase superfamily lysophospholipase